MSHLASVASLSIVSSLSVIPANAPHPLLLGTHDGSFHCDEALALAMLTLLPEYQKATILRSRNPELLAACRVVVDVGAVYDPDNHRYDHHQKEFTGTFDDKHSIKLSSAGLVYKHFGRRIVQSILSASALDKAYDETLVEICFQKIYNNFIQHIDGIDNGVEVAAGELLYDISTTLSARVGRLNPAWNEDQSPDASNESFRRALQLTGDEFSSQVVDLAKHWWPARSIVLAAVNARTKVHPSGSVLLLDQYCPWTSHLFDIETEMGIAPVLYVVYGDSGGSWRVQAVPEKLGSFASRKKLGPPSWHGLRDNELSEHTGIEGCVFVHAGGFIGGNKTKEGALKMAVQALAL